MVPALPRMTRALDYPTRLVRIVVGFQQEDLPTS
jgi:hypothetical protein